MRAYTHLALSAGAQLFRLALSDRGERGAELSQPAPPAPVRGERRIGAADRARPGPVARSGAGTGRAGRRRCRRPSPNCPPTMPPCWPCATGPTWIMRLSRRRWSAAGDGESPALPGEGAAAALAESLYEERLMNRRPAEHPSDEQLVTWRETPADRARRSGKGWPITWRRARSVPPGWRNWPPWKPACRRSRRRARCRRGGSRPRCWRHCRWGCTPG